MAIRNEFEDQALNIEAADDQSPLVLAQNDTPAAGDIPAPDTAAPPASLLFEVEDGSIVRLPEGASIDSPRVNGENLEFVQPDGSVIVIPNGAVEGLTIFIGNIEIPPQTVAALFEANDIQAAAGPDAGANSQSGGGNFIIPPGGIGSGLPFGDLLPPTELSFGALTDQPRFEDLLEDEEPSVNGLPSIGRLASLSVDEEGLVSPYPGNPGDSYPGTGGDLPGENISDSGSLGLDFGSDGPHPTAAVILSAPGATWTQTTNITGILSDGSTWQIEVKADGSYVFTVLGPFTHTTPNVEDDIVLDITVTVADGNGDTTSAGFTVTVDDDGPVAADYTHPSSFTENSGAQNLGDAATLLGIEAGADGLSGTLQDIVFSGGGGGTLAIDVSGNLIYTPAANVVPAGATETFSYTVTDGDNDAVTKEVTFTVTDTGVTNVAASADLVVDEDDLPTIGNNDFALGDDTPTLSGTLSYTLGSDGFGSIVLSTGATGLTKLDGTPVNTVWDANTNTLIGFGGVNQADVVFTITLSAIGTTANQANQATYTVTLLQPVDHPAQDDPSTTGTTETAFEDNLGFTVTATVMDGDGSSDDTSFTVSIDDDTPVIDSISNAVIANESGLTVTGYHDGLVGADGLGQYSIEGLTVVDGLYYYTFENVDGSATLVASTTAGQTPAVPGDVTSQYFTIDVNTDGTYDLTLVSERPVTNIPITFPNQPGGASVETIDVSAGALTVQFDGGVLSGGVLTNLGTGDANDDLKPTGTGFGIGASPGTTIDDGEGFFVTVTDGATPTTADSLTFSVAREGGGGSTHQVTVHWIYLDEMGNPSGEFFQVVDLSTNNTGYPITIDPAGEFSELRVWFTDIQGANNVRIESFELGTAIIPQDQALQFQIGLTDADGDTATSTFSATFAGGDPAQDGANLVGTNSNDVLQGGSAAEVLNGGAGNDILTGGDGDDVLIGGFGSDEMTGGAGADTFVIGSDALALAIDDLITDYAYGPGGDVVDLTDVFAMLGANAPINATEADQVVNLDTLSSPGTTIVLVDDDGTAGGTNFVPVATLTGTHTTVTILFEDGTPTTDII